MKRVKTALAASILLVLSFIFSCTPEGNGGGNGGTSGTTNYVSCDIMGACVPNYTSELCTASGGTVVGSCGSSSSGGGSSSSVVNDGYLLNCNMTATNVTFGFGAKISPTPKVQCNGMDISPSLITWENNPPEIIGNKVTVKAIANCGTSPKEANCGTIKVTVYCDYGYATTNHKTDWCVAITEVDPEADICGPVGDDDGEPVESCNSADRREDLIYCDWGPVNSDGGGCYRAENNSKELCTASSGTWRLKCPTTSLGL